MAILKPRVLFGSVVWFNTSTEGKVSKILSLLENSANRLMLSAFKSSPTTQMQHGSNLPTLKALAIRYHHNYIYKRLKASPSHPARVILQHELTLSPRTHLSPIHRLLRRTDLIYPNETILETIHPYPSPPWVGKRWTVANVGDHRDDVKEQIPTQVEDKEQRQACVVFTDGLYIPEVGGGAAAAMEDCTASHAYGPLEGILTYEMEAMAIMIAIVQFRQRINTDPDKFDALAIFSDSQAALDLLARLTQPKTLQYLSRFLRRSYNMIPKEYPLRLYWTPGHEGVNLNETADAAAKKAAEDNKDPLILPISLGGLLQHSRAVAV